MRVARGRWKIDVKRAMQPVNGDFTEEEVKLLGDLYEHSGFRVFEKYLHGERLAQINNGLIAAKDLVEFGHTQGAVSMCNKIEADMLGFNTDAQEIRKQKSVQQEAEKVEEDFETEYHEDTI